MAPKLAKVLLTADRTTLVVGESALLTAAPQDVAKQLVSAPVTFGVSDPEKAVITPAGTRKVSIRATKAGYLTVDATAVAGGAKVTGTLRLTVKAPVVPPPVVDPVVVPPVVTPVVVPVVDPVVVPVVVPVVTPPVVVPVVTPVLTPPPADAGTLAAAFTRDDSASAGRWGVPIPPRFAGAADGDLRLYRTDTGGEIPTTAPVRLAGAGRVLAIGAVLPAGALPPVAYRFSATGLPRLGDALGWSGLAAWPTDAADLCACALVVGPLVPKASRGTLPAAFVALDDDYARAHAVDFAQRDLEYAAAMAPGGTDGAKELAAIAGRQAGSQCYDQPATAIGYGCRVGGTDGHGYLRRGIERLRRYATLYADGWQWRVNVASIMCDGLPAAFWLTGDPVWRQRGERAATEFRWLYGIPSIGARNEWPNYAALHGQPRGGADVLRALLAAERLAIVSDGMTDQGSFGAWGPGELARQLEAMLAALAAAQRTPGSGPLAGSWAGTAIPTVATTDPAVLAQPTYAPPGTSAAVTFQVGFMCGVLADVLTSAERGDVALSADLGARVAAMLRATLDYYTPRIVGDGGYQYTYPVPTAYDAGALTETWGLNSFWFRSLAWAARHYGAPYRDRLDALAATLAAHRLPGGQITPYFASPTNAVACKMFDETYTRLWGAMADRAAA